FSNSGAVPEVATSASAAATPAFTAPTLEFRIPECDVRIALPVIDVPAHNKLGGQIRAVLNIAPRNVMIAIPVLLLLVFGILLAMRIVAWQRSTKPSATDTDNTDNTNNAADLADTDSWSVSSRAVIASTNSGVDVASVDSGVDVASADSGVDVASADLCCTTYADAEKLSDRMTVASLKE
ncbi:hypothetical protein LPJ59_005286, partial [Coemansia sp. RSA 2399]